MYIYEFYQKIPTSQRMHASRDPPMMLCFIQLRTLNTKDNITQGRMVTRGLQVPLEGLANHTLCNSKER